jgi:hypothetical protein
MDPDRSLSTHYQKIFKSTGCDGLNQRADMDLGTLLFNHHFLQNKATQNINPACGVVARSAKPQIDAPNFFYIEISVTITEFSR